MTQLNVAIQMDPIDSIDITGDTSFRLALEAQRRNHFVHVYEPKNLSWSKDGVTAKIQSVKLKDKIGEHFKIEETTNSLLEKFDVILMRQDPPFDMSYITATHLLEHLPETTLVINNPREVRNAPEKLLVTNFADLMPPTLISNDREQINDFREDYKDIIIKPLYGNGGFGVFRIQPDDQNLNSLLEMFASMSKEQLMIQKYISDVRNGDKRIIIIDGEPVGAINRIPAKNEARSNMHVGGKASPSQLTDRDHYICNRLGPTLKQRGLLFVGIDVIGDYLTEINVTSPTGIREIENFSKKNIAKITWELIEDKANFLKNNY